jgi:hypothetical protein
VALSGTVLWRRALSSEVAQVIIVEVGVAEGGSSDQWSRQT